MDQLLSNTLYSTQEGPIYSSKLSITVLVVTNHNNILISGKTKPMPLLLSSEDLLVVMVRAPLLGGSQEGGQWLGPGVAAGQL